MRARERARACVTLRLHLCLTLGVCLTAADDLMRIANERGEQLSESMELVLDMISALDTNAKGHIDFGDFMAAVESTPILVDAFECLLPSPALLKKHVSTPVN